MAPVKTDRKLSCRCLLNENRQCHGMGFCGYRFFFRQKVVRPSILRWELLMLILGAKKKKKKNVYNTQGSTVFIF